MSIEKRYFGTLPDGRTVNSYTLFNAKGMRVMILDLGGILCQIHVPDKEGRLTDVVGGYDNLDYYVNASGYQGALIGRFGNRIGMSKFTLDGKEYTLFANNNDVNHLLLRKRTAKHLRLSLNTYLLMAKRAIPER